jgi:hypothetical protein
MNKEETTQNILKYKELTDSNQSEVNFTKDTF